MASFPPVSANAPWLADLGDGSYRNPILHADYSDPDAIRVGDDYWMTSSSFSHVPGLPILHSRDLVNWRLVAYALPRLVPEDVFAVPRHGKGVWAPSLRWRAGTFHIFYPDPDFGIYVVTAADPRGPWSAPTLLKGGRGMIDPCPFWDDDGRVYLIHAWAESRSRVGNALTLLELDASCSRVIDDFGYVIHGDRLPGFTFLEGPKLYKRNGRYYVFAPAGGVPTGWQTVFRSDSIRGPYDYRVCLGQGKTEVNGPHQGALVDTPKGESWFLHFQDKGVYGRIVHLQPVAWKDDWPLMGTAVETGAVLGEPVDRHPKPALSPGAAEGLVCSDDFAGPSLGLPWQWQANPRADWFSLSSRPGRLRLFGGDGPDPENLYETPQLLLQKFPAPAFTATTAFEFASLGERASAGLLVFGYDYAWIGITHRDGVSLLVLATRREAQRGAPQDLQVAEPILASSPIRILLGVQVSETGECRFGYCLDGRRFMPLGGSFFATVGRWVGAKVGLFAAGSCYADFDYFRVTAARPLSSLPEFSADPRQDNE